MLPASVSTSCARRVTTRPACSSAPRPPQPAKGGRATHFLSSVLGLGSRPPPERVAATQTNEQEPDVEGAEAPSPSGTKVTSLDSLSTLASKLLMNAASLRVVRGQTHCTHCCGTGKETCPACQGAGIITQEPVRMNQMRHAAGKLKVLLGVEDSKMRDGDWQKTNRCRRCHGTGALPCKHCGGTGRLGPAQ